MNSCEEKVYFHFLLTACYQGSNYHGWQIQPKGATVQREINLALQRICNSRDIKTVGASRTDTGVHALGQILKVTLPIDRPLNALKDGLNSLMPKDIHIKSAKKCSKDFHPLSKGIKKEYLYLFCDKSNYSPLYKDLITCLPKAISLSDFEVMQEGAKLFLGKHDFDNFYCQGSDHHTTVRTIFSIDLQRCSGEFPLYPSVYYRFKIVGDGFLKQMVRLIVGTLWNLAFQKLLSLILPMLWPERSPTIRN